MTIYSPYKNHPLYEESCKVLKLVMSLHDLYIRLQRPRTLLDTLVERATELPSLTAQVFLGGSLTQRGDLLWKTHQLAHEIEFMIGYLMHSKEIFCKSAEEVFQSICVLKQHIYRYFQREIGR